MKHILFSGSLREASYNRKLLGVADGLLRGPLKQETQTVDLRKFSLPVYDGDIEAKGFPAGVLELGKLISGAQSLVIASPEYNWSIAGSLKNTIDWISRLRPVPFDKKPVFLMGASMGWTGSVRAHLATRPSFEALNAYLYPQSYGLPSAADAFQASGDLVDSTRKENLQKMLSAYLQFAERFI